MNESLVGHISSKENPADLATKVIGGGQQRAHCPPQQLFCKVDSSQRCSVVICT
jgi:hypothetical protein